MIRVGFIGLGSQGGPIARRIIEAKFPMTLWARRPATLEAFTDLPVDPPVSVAQSPAQLAAASDVVCICVTDDAGLEEVVTGEHGVLAGLSEGGVIVVHSTVHPDTCRRLAELAENQGVSLIDAPVSGGGMGAAAGHLLVMVGGDAKSLDYCRPVFKTYADPVIHLGEVGAGQVAKLLNNLLFTANLATAISALALGEELGVDPQLLPEVLTHGSANSFALGRISSAGGSLDRIAAHAGGLLQKDVRLIADLAETEGVPGGIVLAAADATLTLMDLPR